MENKNEKNINLTLKMRREKIKIKEFEELLTLFETESEVYILPYALIFDEKTQSTKCYTILLQELTGFIRPITAQVTATKPGYTIAKALREATYGIIDIAEEKYDSRMTVFLTSDEDYNGDPFIVENKVPVVTVELKLASIDQLNKIIAKYIHKLKYKMAREPTMAGGFSTNLVYISESDLFYLARGTTYTTYDEDGEYEFEVSKGMFFEPQIVDLYTPSKSKGEIPISQINNSDSNFPFQSVTFSKISNGFAIEIHEIMISMEGEDAIFT